MESKGWGVLLPLIISVICLASGCSNRKVSSDTMKRSLDNEPQKIVVSNILESFPFDELIDSVRYIPLQSIKGDIFIGNIEKVISLNDRFYVLDTKTARGLFCFDMNGRHLFSLNQRGNGPGEFVSISDFDVNEDLKQIYVYDEGNGRMSLFNLDGDYLGAGPKLSAQGILPDCFVLLGDNIVSYNKNNCNDKGCNSIQITNLNNELVTQGIDNEFLRGFNVDFGTPIARNGNEVTFTQLLNDTIYYLDKDLSIKTPYVIDFGKYKMSLKERRELVNKPEQVLTFFTQSNKTPGSVFINLNDNFFLIEFFQNKFLVTLLIDRITGKYKVYRKYEFNNDIYLPVSDLVGHHKDKFLFFNNNENILDFKTSRGQYEESQYEGVLKSIDDNTNGVIAIVKFRSL